MDKDLYMHTLTRLIIISVPPEPLRKELEELRLEICKLTNSQESLRYPVHLTLRTGILLPEEERVSFFTEFSHYVHTHLQPFHIKIGMLVAEMWPPGSRQGAGGGFVGCTVEKTPELMEAHQLLVAFEKYRKGPQYPYHPHITMAFDDLTIEGLENVKSLIEKQKYRFFQRHWTCSSIDFYRNNGAAWVLDTTVSL